MENEMKAMFFFAHMEYTTKDEIIKTGETNNAVFLFPDESGENDEGTTIPACEVPSIFDKNGVEFIAEMIKFQMHLISFKQKVQDENNLNIIASFHRELSKKDDDRYLYIIKKFGDNEPIIQRYKVLTSPSTIDDNGNILVGMVEFVEDEN